MVEGARLESVCTPKGYQGFESLSLRNLLFYRELIELQSTISIIGEMSEWSKEHAWKVCILQNGIKGSNPFLSATNKVNSIIV